MDRIVREAIKIELHPNNMNREMGFGLSSSWKPLICSLMIPPEHDARSTRLCGHAPVATSPKASGSILADIPDPIPVLACYLQTSTDPSPPLSIDSHVPTLPPLRLIHSWEFATGG
jgi:hypothetical protein